MLRGMGVAIGLPFLDAMVPAQTPLAHTAASPLTRFACIEMVHGAAGSTIDGSRKHYWSPEQSGADFEFTQTLEPLKQFREYLTIVSNTDLDPGRERIAQGGRADHFRSSAAFLTASHPKMTEGADIFASLHRQMYAQQFGQIRLCRRSSCVLKASMDRRLRLRLRLRVFDTISWSTPTTPLPMTIDPRVAFENLFGVIDARGTPRPQREKSSILDMIRTA